MRIIENTSQCLVKEQIKTTLETFDHVPFVARSLCEVCGNRVDGSSVLSWPDFPMTEIYVKEPVKEKKGLLDLDLQMCARCGHAQLARVIDPQIQYGQARSYHFRASESASGRQSAEFFLDFFNRIIPKNHVRTILEVGCNDLYVLKSLRDRADVLIGIDPVLKDVQSADPKIQALGCFFEDAHVDRLADVVICKDTLEHVARPREFLEKMIGMSSPDAVFVFQFPLLETLLEGFRFDHIFHQHLNYFSFASIDYLLAQSGCELLDYAINYNLWGSILIAFKKRKAGKASQSPVKRIVPSEIQLRYGIFQNQMEVTRQRLKILSNDKLYGFGAALMLPVLDYHLQGGLSYLQCVLDDDIRKEGLNYINLSLNIQPTHKFENLTDAHIFITAFATTYNVRQILKNLIEKNPKSIILPLNIV